MSGCHNPDNFVQMKCVCTCHLLHGSKFMKGMNPPVPCCPCDNFIGYSQSVEKPPCEPKCKCVYCLDKRIEKLEKQLHDKPYECPVCKGMRKFQVFGKDREADCPACEGKGIVWKN